MSIIPTSQVHGPQGLVQSAPMDQLKTKRSPCGPKAFNRRRIPTWCACTYFNYDACTKTNDTQVVTCELHIHSLNSNVLPRNTLQPHMSPRQSSCVIGKLPYVTRKPAKSITMIYNLPFFFPPTQSQGLIHRYPRFVDGWLVWPQVSCWRMWVETRAPIPCFAKQLLQINACKAIYFHLSAVAKKMSKFCPTCAWHPVFFVLSGKVWYSSACWHRKKAKKLMLQKKN